MLGQCPGPCLLVQHLAVPRAHPHSQQTAQVPEATKLQQGPALLLHLPGRSSPREGPHQHGPAPTWPPALWLQRMHITFTCLGCNLRCSPALAGVTGCPRAAWLMSGATATPKPWLSNLSPLPLTSKVSVPPVFVKREKEDQLCWVTKLSEDLQTQPHFSCCLL